MESTKTYREEIRICILNAKTEDDRIRCAQNTMNKITDAAVRERLKTQLQILLCRRKNPSARHQLACFTEAYQTTSEPVVKEDIETLIKEAAKLEKFAKESRSVTVEFNGLPPGKAQLTTYVVDKSHANGCAYNKSTERLPSEKECGVGGNIDAMVAQAQAEARAKAGGDIQALSALYFYGAYTTPSGEKLSTSIWMDMINNDPRISLEGSSKTEEVMVPGSGSYKKTVVMEPWSVVLFEIDTTRRP